MNRSLLLTRPNYDDTTYYLSAWAKKIIQLAEGKGLEVLDLEGDRANSREVASVIKKKNPECIMFNGHGGDDHITGHKQEIILQLGKNEALLRGRLIYSVACKSAKLLGKQSLSAAFIGYEEDFIFVYEPNRMSKPSNDATAGLFFEPSNEVMVSLLKENSPEEAHRRAKDQFRENMKKTLTSEAVDGGVIARYLWWDMHHLVIHQV